MNQKSIEEKIVEYIKDELSPDEKTLFVEELKKAGYSLDEVEKRRNTFNSIDEIDVPEPSSAMDEKFYEMLYSNKSAKQNFSIGAFYNQNRLFFRVAASIALFVIGWVGGVIFTSNPRLNPQLGSMQNEMNVMKKMVMLTMMEQSSPTERIKAVNMVTEISNVDSKVFSALLKTLNSDENDNVRLVALEALKGYANYPEVREGLIQSISKQTSPLIQLALANVMVDLQEKRSRPYFEEILKNKELNYSVRKKVDEVVNILI